jgi:RNA-binding protein YlmH
VSRSKMSDLIKAGDVRVNWRPVSKTSIDLKEGDIVSCSGKGRMEVRSITMTKKGKYSVNLVRYV